VKIVVTLSVANPVTTSTECVLLYM